MTLVRYESTEPPCDVHYCHCRLCQRAFGNVFAVFGSLPVSALSFIRGAPQLYQSTSYAERGFCNACGTPLTFRYLRSEWIAIAIDQLLGPDTGRVFNDASADIASGNMTPEQATSAVEKSWQQNKQ